MKESAIQAQIVQYLTLKGYFFWRNNSGAVISHYKDKIRMFRFGKEGSPDLFVLRNGALIDTECKSPTGRVSDDQVIYRQAFEDAGGQYILARQLEDVMDGLEA
jgi:hypothetical protein